MDVNIAMYAAGAAHPYRQACAWVMGEIADGRLTAAIDAEIVQEILYRYGALKKWKLAVNMAKEVLNLVSVVLPVTQADALLSVNLFDHYAAQGVTARDVIHAAVMQNNDIDQIITVDEHFDQIEGIKRLDPQAMFLAGRIS